MDILGVDEAGRGSVLGPMVIAGVIIPEKMNKVLERMGVKDSKRIVPHRRTILSRKLKKMFEYDIIVITARQIDEMRADGINLNEIEKNAMEELILRLKPEKAIVDAVDVKPERFQENLRKDTGFDIIAEHKADDNYIQVSAASIIAKAERDAQIIKSLLKQVESVRVTRQIQQQKNFSPIILMMKCLTLLEGHGILFQR